MKKVLVTGVSGYLGHHCAVELLKNGYLVKGSLRDPNKKNEVLDGIKKEIDPSNKLEFVKLDLLGDDGWDDAVKGCEYVLHVAAPFSVREPNNEDEYIKPACEGTIRALKFAQKAKVKRIVLTSSTVTMMGEIYDSNQDNGIVNAKSWTNPNSKRLLCLNISFTKSELKGILSNSISLPLSSIDCENDTELVDLFPIVNAISLEVNPSWVDT